MKTGASRRRQISLLKAKTDPTAPQGLQKAQSAATLQSSGPPATAPRRLSQPRPSEVEAAEVVDDSSSDDDVVEVGAETDTLDPIEDGVVYESDDEGADGLLEDEQGPLPPNWLLFFTDEPDKTPYYYNEETEETIWTRPQ